MGDKIFIEGMIFKTRTHPEYGEFKSISIKTEEFKQFLDKHSNDGWLNIDIKKSKDGSKDYGVLNDWKPKQKPEQGTKQEDISVEDLPF